MVGGSDEPVEAVTNGYELAIPADEGSGSKGKVLGSREFARFYRQRPRLDDTRHSVAVNKVLARYVLHHIMTSGRVMHTSLCVRSKGGKCRSECLDQMQVQCGRLVMGLLLSVGNNVCDGRTGPSMIAREPEQHLRI